jgi:adenine-specific DNA glycosylase
MQSRSLVARHGGQFRHTREEVLALSGIGEYTAAAILSIAFDEKLAVLDGNVARVLARLGAIRGDLREPKRWRQLQLSADLLLAPESPGNWNQAMMELGATVCSPRSPQCLLCPVAQFCQGRKLGIAESLPEKRKKRATVAVQLISVVCSTVIAMRYYSATDCNHKARPTTAFVAGLKNVALPDHRCAKGFGKCPRPTAN